VTGERPNIVLIAVHDLGTRLGCYGWNNVPSPNLDGLAAEGVRFENHFCTAPYCSPSRGSIITGKYPHVNGLMGLVNLGWDWQEGNTTLAQALGVAGYETHLFGFQHEASNDSIDRLGFQHVSDRAVSPRCHEVAPLVEEFLAARDPGDTAPFYARVGFAEVHRSFDRFDPEDPAQVHVPPYLEDTPGARDDFARFDGAIRHMDAHVGRILDALDKAGLRDNTLVVFTTDHGIAFPGAKATLYDPGMNTTLVMRWPGHLAPGSVHGEMLSNVDLFPTLLEIAGCDVPEDIQGRSFLPLVAGGEYVPREWVFAGKNTTAVDIKRCIRTKQFKYIRNYKPGPRLHLSSDIEISLTRRDMGNDHLAPRAQVELYDLQADPLERNNLAEEPAMAETRSMLADRLQGLQEETQDPILEGPIQRPATEATIYNGVLERIRTACPFSRDGLTGAYEALAEGRYGEW